VEAAQRGDLPRLRQLDHVEHPAVVLDAHAALGVP
jgi:hypothetical protein